VFLKHQHFEDSLKNIQVQQRKWLRDSCCISDSSPSSGEKKNLPRFVSLANLLHIRSLFAKKIKYSLETEGRNLDKLQFNMLIFSLIL